MTINLGKRILMIVHWLFSLLICAAFAVYVIVPDFALRLYGAVEAALGLVGVRVAGIALLVLYAALAVGQAFVIFGRKKRVEKGFITVDSDDKGRVRIAVSAIEQMVRQSVDGVEGIVEMQIDISDAKDAIAIVVNAVIASGSHVPTVTMNMQRAIRQFVETNCGVSVRTVTISINSVANQAEAHRRRRFGKSEPAAPVPAPIPEAVVEAPTQAPEPVASEEASEVPEQTDAPVEADIPAYDPDAPYESEFAKDLAAMKEADTSEADADEEA